MPKHCDLFDENRGRRCPPCTETYCESCGFNPKVKQLRTLMIRTTGPNTDQNGLRYLKVHIHKDPDPIRFPRYR